MKPPPPPRSWSQEQKKEIHPFAACVPLPVLATEKQKEQTSPKCNSSGGFFLGYRTCTQGVAQKRKKIMKQIFFKHVFPPPPPLAGTVFLPTHPQVGGQFYRNQVAFEDLIQKIEKPVSPRNNSKPQIQDHPEEFSRLGGLSRDSLDGHQSKTTHADTE